MATRDRPLLLNKQLLHPPVEFGQFTSLRYGERLANIDATLSIGTLGDFHANALSETVSGYYKIQLHGAWHDDIAYSPKRRVGNGPITSAPDARTSGVTIKGFGNEQEHDHHDNLEPPTSAERAGFVVLGVAPSPVDDGTAQERHVWASCRQSRHGPAGTSVDVRGPQICP